MPALRQVYGAAAAALGAGPRLSRRSELDPRYAQLPAFGAATGLRLEEWGALERRHVYRARRLVRVEQMNVDAVGLPGAKTRGSAREVPLARAALDALDAMTPRLDTPLLFAAPEGGPLDLYNFRKRVWAPAVESAGVATPATPYDLCDTFASNALHAGVTVFQLAKVMGTSVRMIERHYGDGARRDRGQARRYRGAGITATRERNRAFLDFRPCGPSSRSAGSAVKPVRPWQRRTIGGIDETWQTDRGAPVHHRRCFEDYVRDLFGEQQPVEHVEPASTPGTTRRRSAQDWHT